MPSAEEDLSLRVELGRHQLQLRGGLRQGNEVDRSPVQRHHLTHVASVQRIDRVQTESGGKYPVEGGRAATTLHVTKHRGSGFLARPLSDLPLQQISNAREPSMAEGINPGQAGRHCPFGRQGAFGNYHDRRIVGSESMVYVRADLVDMER